MIARRRFAPLIALVGITFAALMVRLYQVQVVEHDIWAAEATNLVRSAQTIPYLRGTIRDRNDEVFVKDEEAHAIRFVYREFRRRHPLGQVAHAASVLEGRRISLQVTTGYLEEWGMALVESVASEVDRFARGERATIAGVNVAAVEPGSDRRRSRAGELRFYIRGLLDPDLRDWNRIRKRLKKGRTGQATWIELVAGEQHEGVEEVRERVRTRLRKSLVRLGQLALQMEVHGPDGMPAVSSEAALGYLIDALEAKRREIEASIARDLFLEATGFYPGRLGAATLLSIFDLGFLGDALGWTQEELSQWIRDERASWLEDRRTFHIPRAEISARLRIQGSVTALDALLGEFAVLYSRRPRTPREARARSHDWRAIDELAVFAELPDLFEDVEFDLDSGLAPIPTVDPQARRKRAATQDVQALAHLFVPFHYAAGVALEYPPAERFDWAGSELGPWSAPVSSAVAVERVLLQSDPHTRAAALHGGGRRDVREDGDEEELLPWAGRLWEARFQETLEVELSRLVQQALSEGHSLPLVLSAARLKRADKKADYFIRDRGSRPETIDDSPDDRVVRTLTRFIDEYRGFEVLPRTRRLAMALDEDDLLVARELIGVVRESTLGEVLGQQSERSDLQRILAKVERTRADEERIDELVASIYRADEVHGSSGIEGLMDDVLRGTNGFSVSVGLQELEEGSRGSLKREKIDGKDINLTLSLDLQMAAQRIIEQPKLPPGEDKRDEYWFRNPVGAIVLATVDGEILAAASAPKESHEPSPARDGERAFHYDRSLRIPRFQPIGSIFKPFVAAYALSQGDIDPRSELLCDRREGGGSPGWGKVACWNPHGHGKLTLAPAIHDSCNAYFAQVGELIGTQERFGELAHVFGFDRPTGVRQIGTETGLVEAYGIRRLHQGGEFSRGDLNRAGNGLTVIQATPVQVARAVAGLATGRLPQMRLVRAVDGAPVPATYEDIPLDPAALQFVREAMRGVITQGSAKWAKLGEDDLHFKLAGKTGSADYDDMTPEYLRELSLPPGATPPQMRKHTWFIGFFPAEAPTTVVVVFCHDIGVTSSHTAVHIAAQFLQSDEVQAYFHKAM